MKNNEAGYENEIDETSETNDSPESSSDSHFESTYKLKANEQYESEGYDRHYAGDP